MLGRKGPENVPVVHSYKLFNCNHVSLRLFVIRRKRLTFWK